MNTLRALDLAAAALRDSRRNFLATGNTTFASEIFEAHDHIQHLRHQHGGNAALVPHETIGLAATQQVPVLTMAQVAALPLNSQHSSLNVS